MSSQIKKEARSSAPLRAKNGMKKGPEKGKGPERKSVRRKPVQSERKRSIRTYDPVNVSTPRSRPSPYLPTARRGTLLKPLFSSKDDYLNAPAAVASTNQKRTMSLQGDMYSGLRVHVCCPFTTVIDATAAAGNSTQPGMQNSGFSTTSATTSYNNNLMCLSPFFGYAVSNTQATSSFAYIQSMCTWSSPSLADLSLGFSRYRVHSLVFHYEPNALTSQERSYMFSYTEDPMSPTLGLRAYFTNPGTVPTGNAPPGITALDTGVSNILFQAWQAWSMKVPVDQNLKYLYAPSVSTPTTGYGVYDVATVRDTMFGAINLVNLTGSGSGSAFGRLWIELDLELTDPTPMFTGTSTAPSLTMSRLFVAHDHLSRREEKSSTADPLPPLSSLRPVRLERKSALVLADPPPPPPGSREVRSRLSSVFASDAADDDTPEMPSPPRFQADPSSLPGSDGYHPSSRSTSRK
jgi:hypothetical protein